MDDHFEKALEAAKVDLYNRHLQQRDEPPRDPWAVLEELLERFESLLRMSADDTAKALKALKTKHTQE